VPPDAPRVLLVIGAYHPEISAAGIQARAVASALAGRATFSVLATAVDPTLPPRDLVDGVPVYRARVDVKRRASRAAASIRVAAQFAAARDRFDLVHIHGISRKNVPVTTLARLFGKRILLHLHTAGQDEPGESGRAGVLGDWSFRQAELVLPVSPLLMDRCLASGIDRSRLRYAPNGVDPQRFAPRHEAARAALRAELGWPIDARVTLFVGFFSRDKRPDAVFRAWRRGAARDPRAVLVFVGATLPKYYEIDGALFDRIRSEASAAGLSGRVIFADTTTAIERFFAAADVFVLPSVREAMPLALLEAMSSGLACVASRLERSTDVLIQDGVNGRLVPADDEDAWATALAELTGDCRRARELGRCARATVVDRFTVEQSSRVWLEAYRELTELNKPETL